MQKYPRIHAVFISALIVILPCGALAEADTASQSQRFVRAMTEREACLVCHYSFDVTDAAHGAGSLWLDAKLMQQSAHASLRCAECHTDIGAAGHCMSLACDQPSPYPAWLKSAALQSCITCHPEQAATYRGSAHGFDVLVEGDTVPPYCTDCHGTHYILPKEDPRSWTNAANVARNCLKCHAVTDVKQRYGLTLDVAGTYQKSFHGLRAELGEQRVAVCTTCHSNHGVFRIDDPRSRVKASELARACGECHEGARYNFAAAFSHKKIGQEEQSSLFVVKQMHLWLIVFCTAGFLFVVLTDLRAKLKRGGGAAHG